MAPSRGNLQNNRMFEKSITRLTGSPVVSLRYVDERGLYQIVVYPLKVHEGEGGEGKVRAAAAVALLNLGK